MREVPIDRIAQLLRFNSPAGKDPLTVKDGRVRAQQLQRIRRLTRKSARLLEQVWEEGAFTASNEFLLPEEIEDIEDIYEGAVRQITVNAYERSREARQKCIAYYGARCSVCDFDFGTIYGEVGKGLIHVHHLRSLAQIGESYEVDAIRDLRPVCPNCHAIIHRHRPPYEIKDVKVFLRKGGLQLEDDA